MEIANIIQADKRWADAIKPTEERVILAQSMNHAKQKVASLILFIDFKKAFDSIGHAFINTT